MATKNTRLQSRYTTVAGRVPGAGDLLTGELGINLTDQKVYTKTEGGVVFPIGWAGVPVRKFGVTGDGTTDDTDAIRAAGASGETLVWHEGVYRTTEGIEFSTPQRWIPQGRVKFQYDAPSGSVVEVQLWFKDYVFAVGDFWCDHNALAGGYIEPEPNPGGFVKPHGNCVIVSGDFSNLDGWRIENSWDNGITIGRYNESTWAGVPGSPVGVRLSNVITRRCGRGLHGSVVSGFSGMLGGGVSVASGGGAVISNCFDFESTQGFVHDVGAGGSASFQNCHAWFTKRDFVNGAGGTSWYVGTGDSQFVNCGSTGADWDAWDVDSPATNCQYTNCFGRNPGRAGLHTRAGDSVWIGFRVNDPWQSGGPGHAILIDTGGAGGSGGTRSVTGLSFIAPANQYTSRTSYGLGFVGDGVGSAEVIGGALAGLSGEVNRNGKELIWLRNSAGTLQMQLSGGGAYLSGGTWTAPVQLGENRLWVDSGGRLRIKNGAPMSEGDGVPVGTQA